MVANGGLVAVGYKVGGVTVGCYESLNGNLSSLNIYFHKSNHRKPNTSGPSPYLEISILVYTLCGCPIGSTVYLAAAV
jgi:hypothetical protein